MWRITLESTDSNAIPKLSETLQPLLNNIMNYLGETGGEHGNPHFSEVKTEASGYVAC